MKTARVLLVLLCGLFSRFCSVQNQVLKPPFISLSPVAVFCAGQTCNSGNSGTTQSDGIITVGGVAGVHVSWFDTKIIVAAPMPGSADIIATVGGLAGGSPTGPVAFRRRDGSRQYRCSIIHAESVHQHHFAIDQSGEDSLPTRSLRRGRLATWPLAISMA